MRGRRAGAMLLAAALVAVVGLLAHFAVLDGLAAFPFLAAVGAARSLITVVAGVVAVAGVVVAIMMRHPRLVVLPVALLAVAGVSGATMLSRGFANEPPAAGGLRILSWNTNGGLVDPSVVAALASRTEADVVVLPQLGVDADGAAFRVALEREGLTAAPETDPDDQTVVFTAVRLGGFRADSGTRPEPDSSTVAVPTAPRRAPTIVAVHLAKPILGHAAVQASDFSWIGDRCHDPNIVVVGDFNATVDTFGGPGLGACRDAASITGEASTGSWPTLLPPPLAMPIDHVLVGADWRVRSFTVLTGEDGSGARHRPIFAVLTHTS